MNPLRRIRDWCSRKTRPEFVPEGMNYPCYPPPIDSPFVHGIELVNDETTPLLFALQVLHVKAGLPHRDAATAVAICHEKGGVLVPMSSLERATEVADQIVTCARREAWPLACRAVSAPLHATPDQPA